MDDRNDGEPGFEGGSQPVREEPPETPGAGRTVARTVVLIVAGLVVLAVVLYLFARLGGG